MEKTCYIIGPIGKPDSDVRKWADFVKSHIIKPVVTECGYQDPQRSDIDQAESSIMTGIVQQMFGADLVIADLTGHNPNVFYELGIRNCAKKPVIHLIKDGQSPPFDLAGNRAISISTDHVETLKAHAEIKERIKAIEKNPDQFFSHIEIYMLTQGLDVLKKAGTQADSGIADTLKVLLAMTESNSDRLGRICRATVGEVLQMPEYPDNMVFYEDPETNEIRPIVS